MVSMEAVLSIAGSDSSGGAGIQADIKTIAALGLFAETAVTALTAQNTTGVFGVLDVDPAFVAQQIDVVFEDIRPAAVKVGMVSSSAIVAAIAEALARNHAENVVVDPVMVATSGARLMEESAVDTLRRELLPLATVLTPNLPEAEMLSGQSISTPADMERCARLIGETYGCAVLCKGGHEVNSANDYLWQPGGGRWFYGRRIDNPNTHGTGCTLSSAIASNLARGRDLEKAVYEAKCYLSGALAAMLDLGHGSGPMNHAFAIEGQYTQSI